MLPIATGVRNPPDPTSAAPGISMIAIRFGPQDQTAREFRTFGGFWRLRGIQKSLKKHGGDPRASGGPGPDPRKPNRGDYHPQKSGPGCCQSDPAGSDPRDARSRHSSDPLWGAGSDAPELLEIWWISEIAGIPEIPEK